MTEEEAQKIKPGDVLLTRISGKGYEAVEVARIGKSAVWIGGAGGTKDVLIFYVYRKNSRRRTDRLGNPLPMLTRRAKDVGWASDRECAKDPLQSNVWADWLEESGFLEAAQAMRAAFPLAVPQQVQQPQQQKKEE